MTQNSWFVKSYSSGYPALVSQPWSFVVSAHNARRPGHKKHLLPIENNWKKDASHLGKNGAGNILKEQKICWSDLLFALDGGQSFSHQFLVDPAEVGYFLLAFMMDIHATLCTENTAVPQFIMWSEHGVWEHSFVSIMSLIVLLYIFSHRMCDATALWKGETDAR